VLLHLLSIDLQHRALPANTPHSAGVQMDCDIYSRGCGIQDAHFSRTPITKMAMRNSAGAVSLGYA
jgi:hypothetical protein